MKKSGMVVCALSTIFLGGCATQVGAGPPSAALLAGSDPVPKESVAAERCPESYQIRNARQGTFHREIVC